jgi:hypothetical protein
MTATTATTTHRLRRAVLLVGVVLLAVVAALPFLLGGGKGTRWTFTPPGASAASRAPGGIPIDLPADLSDAGLKAEDAGVSQEAEQIVILHKERASLKVALTTGKAPVEFDGLRYTLYGPAGEKLSDGRLCGKLSLPPEGRTVLELEDVDVVRASRVVLDK